MGLEAGSGSRISGRLPPILPVLLPKRQQDRVYECSVFGKHETLLNVGFHTLTWSISAANVRVTGGATLLSSTTPILPALST